MNLHRGSQPITSKEGGTVKLHDRRATRRRLRLAITALVVSSAAGGAGIASGLAVHANAVPTGTPPAASGLGFSDRDASRTRQSSGSTDAVLPASGPAQVQSMGS